MSKEFDSNAEYLEANHHLIQDIVTAVDSHLDEAIGIPRLAITPDQTNPTFISGAITAEDIMVDVAEVGANLTYEEALDMAQIHNRALMGRAALATVGLQTSMTKQYVADRYQEDPVSAKEEPLALLPFTAAVYATMDGTLEDGTLISLRRTKMDGLKRYHEAAEHTVETDEDGVTQVTTFLSSREKPLLVFTSTNLSHDPLFYRAGALLDKSRPELGVIMSGSLRTEEEIGHLLAMIQQQYHGTSKEAEVSPLLDELFERAVSLQANLDMLSKFDLTTPSVGQLEKLRSQLAA